MIEYLDTTLVVRYEAHHSKWHFIHNFRLVEGLEGQRQHDEMVVNADLWTCSPHGDICATHTQCR